MDYEEAKKKYIGQVVLLILILLCLYWACSTGHLFNIIIATLAAGASIYRLHKYYNIMESTKANQTPEENAHQNSTATPHIGRARETVIAAAAESANHRQATLSSQRLSSQRFGATLLSIVSYVLLLPAFFLLSFTVLMLFGTLMGFVEPGAAIFPFVASVTLFVGGYSLRRFAKSMARPIS